MPYLRFQQPEDWRHMLLQELQELFFQVVPKCMPRSPFLTITTTAGLPAREQVPSLPPLP